MFKGKKFTLLQCIFWETFFKVQKPNQNNKQNKEGSVQNSTWKNITETKLELF